MEQTASAGDPSTAKQAAAGRNQAALRAMASGDLAGAETALSEAVSLDATSISAWLNLAVVRRQRKDLEAAFAAIQKVLTLDPRNFPALLMSATMLESLGQGIPTALAYGRALANAPPDQVLDAPTLKAVARGRVVHGAYTRQLGDHIRGQIAESEARCSAAERRLGIRRHHRARGLERERPAALHADLRRMEPTPVARRAHRDRGGHRRDRRIQPHGSRNARLNRPDEQPCS
jgi:tetratricopeptide (TPR) repeat protein